MNKLLSISATLLLLFGGGVRAQTNSNCNHVPINGPGPVTGPTQADKAKITDIDGHLLGDLEFPASGGSLNLDAVMLARIDAAVKASGKPRETIRLTWFRGDTALQADRFKLPSENIGEICPSPPPPSPGTPSTPAPQPQLPTANLRDVTLACHDKFVDWTNDINARHPRGHFLAILFGPDGQILEENKNYGVSGDLIFTAICIDNTFSPEIPRLDFTKCDLQSPIPKNPEGDTLTVKLQSGVEVKLIPYPVRQCFGTSVEMKLTGTKLNADRKPVQINETHKIGMYERYRYTLQVSAVSTDQHVHGFGVRKDNDKMRIFDKGPIDSGPEYMASVVLYALPRYFQRLRTPRGQTEDIESLANRTYFGRDVVNENDIPDRIGLVIGAGLNNPNDRFAMGLSFELVPGVNLIGVYEFAKLKELRGVMENDEFTGTADQIPLRETWNRKFVGGISLDLRYVMGLFRRGT